MSVFYSVKCVILPENAPKCIWQPSSLRTSLDSLQHFQGENEGKVHGREGEREWRGKEGRRLNILLRNLVYTNAALPLSGVLSHLETSVLCGVLHYIWCCWYSSW